jgi:hypothetical protein
MDASTPPTLQVAFWVSFSFAGQRGGGARLFVGDAAALRGAACRCLLFSTDTRPLGTLYRYASVPDVLAVWLRASPPTSSRRIPLTSGGDAPLSGGTGSGISGHRTHSGSPSLYPRPDGVFGNYVIIHRISKVDPVGIIRSSSPSKKFTGPTQLHKKRAAGGKKKRKKRKKKGGAFKHPGFQAASPSGA